MTSVSRNTGNLRVPVGLPADQHGQLRERLNVSSLFGQGSPKSKASSKNLRHLSGDSHSFSGSFSQNHATRSNNDARSGGRPIRTAEQRLVASEIGYATRAALGPSFDFTDEPFKGNSSSSDRKLHETKGLQSSDDGIYCGPPQALERSQSSSRVHPHAYDEPKREAKKISNFSLLDHSGRTSDGAIAEHRHHQGRKKTPQTTPRGSNPYRSTSGHNPFGDAPDEVVRMLQYTCRYKEVYGPHSSRRVPVYHETSSGRPIPLMAASLTPLTSNFDWGDDD